MSDFQFGASEPEIEHWSLREALKRWWKGIKDRLTRGSYDAWKM